VQRPSRQVQQIKTPIIGREKRVAEEHISGISALLDALGAVIKAAPKAERDALASVMEAYAKDFPHNYYEYLWAMGAQSPRLLYHLIHSIEDAVADDGQE
jgi:hypothetical protein